MTMNLHPKERFRRSLVLRRRAKQRTLRVNSERKVAAKVKIVQRMTAARVKVAATAAAASPAVVARRSLTQTAVVHKVTNQDDNELTDGVLGTGQSLLLSGTKLILFSLVC